MNASPEIHTSGSFKEKEKDPLYCFPKETAIYPDHWGSGCWIVKEEEGLLAVKAEGKSISGLGGWIVVERNATLYQDNKFRELAVGKCFGAYANSARRARKEDKKEENRTTKERKPKKETIVQKPLFTIP